MHFNHKINVTHSFTIFHWRWGRWTSPLLLPANPAPISFVMTQLSYLRHFQKFLKKTQVNHQLSKLILTIYHVWTNRNNIHPSNLLYQSKQFQNIKSCLSQYSKIRLPHRYLPTLHPSSTFKDNKSVTRLIHNHINI